MGYHVRSGPMGYHVRSGPMGYHVRSGPMQCVCTKQLLTITICSNQ